MPVTMILSVFLLFLGLSSKVFSLVIQVEASQVEILNSSPSSSSRGANSKNPRPHRETQVDVSAFIPPEAHGAYCTAITGWYNGNCTDPGEDPPPGTEFCDGATYEPLDELVWIDLNRCYSNPNNNGRSVSFFGETPDKKKILEFHMIFKAADVADIPSKYQGVNCLDNGSCECHEALVALKETFLKNGGCADTDEYLCISEDFYGDNEKCFAPSTFKFSTGPNDIYCSMMARVQQYGPCHTVLDIPDEAYDTYCTGITGWYDSCTDPYKIEDNNTLACSTTYTALEKPLFVDLDTCYSNPYQKQRSVTFYGKGPDGKIKEFHLIFKSAIFGDFRPMNCTDLGACQCSPALKILKEELTSKGGCDQLNMDEYTCESGDFYGATDRCYIPATWEGDNDDFYCSMTARIEQFDPCDRSFTFGNETAEDITSHLESSGPAATSSSVPAGGATSDPTPAPPTKAPPLSSVPTAASNASAPFSGAPAASPAESAPTTLGPTFNTAITGWWDDCTPSDADGPENYCSGGIKADISDSPIFINYDSCYSNPNFGGRSVSFYSSNANGDLVAFHLLFTSPESYSTYSPGACAEGVCDCSKPSALGALRDQLLQTKKCFSDDGKGIVCIKNVSRGISEDCYVPLAEKVTTQDADAFFCAMVAEVKSVARIPPGSAASGSAKATSAAGTAVVSSIGGLLVVGSFVLVAFVFFRIRRLQAEKHFDHSDANMDEDEVVWVKKNAHNPQYSTRHSLGHFEEGDGLFKSVGMTSSIDDNFSIS